ncbi:LuxR C-terminal-related transcriptional regulator [Serratia ureilytica]
MAELLQAIEQVLDGETRFPPPRWPKSRRRRTAGCSPQRARGTGLVEPGLSNLQIADRLHISNKTVSTHKKNIQRKTGAGNLLELVAVFKELAP